MPLMRLLETAETSLHRLPCFLSLTGLTDAAAGRDEDQIDYEYQEDGEDEEDEDDDEEDDEDANDDDDGSEEDEDEED